MSKDDPVPILLCIVFSELPVDMHLWIMESDLFTSFFKDIVQFKLF